MKIVRRNAYLPALAILGSALLVAAGIVPSHALSGQNLSVSSANYALAHTSHLKVTNVKGIPGDSSITVSWTAPTYVSNYPILGYSVWANYKSPTTGKRVSTLPVDTADGIQTSVVLTGLRNGMAYDFTIVARNAKEWSAINTNVMVRPSTTPTTPQIVRVVSGKGKATVYWLRTFNGGVTQKFAVTTSANNLVVGVKQNIFDNHTYPSTVITGLTNGTEYTFSVSASNANGTSTSESSQVVIPRK